MGLARNRRGFGTELFVHLKCCIKGTAIPLTDDSAVCFSLTTKYAQEMVTRSGQGSSPNFLFVIAACS